MHLSIANNARTRKLARDARLPKLSAVIVKAKAILRDFEPLRIAFSAYPIHETIL